MDVNIVPTHFYSVLYKLVSPFQIPDLRTAFEVLKLLQVNPRGMGLKTKDDAIRVIVETLEQGVDPASLKQVGGINLPLACKIFLLRSREIYYKDGI